MSRLDRLLTRAARKDGGGPARTLKFQVSLAGSLVLAIPADSSPMNCSKPTTTRLAPRNQSDRLSLRSLPFPYRPHPLRRLRFQPDSLQIDP